MPEVFLWKFKDPLTQLKKNFHVQKVILRQLKMYVRLF